MAKSFIKELRKRNVLNVAAIYLIAAWLVAQVADFALEHYHAPDWAMPALLAALGAGFVIALIVSWVFEVTPAGVVREEQVDRTISITDQSGQRLDRTILAIIAVVIIFMGLERFLFSAPGRKPGPPAIETGADAVAVPPTARGDLGPVAMAVLPFSVLSTGPDDHYLGEGLAAELSKRLGVLPRLQVTARGSATQFGQRELPATGFARLLGVSHVVEGSVHRAGTQLRVTAQVTRVGDSGPFWSSSWDFRAEEAAAVQENIVRDMAMALGVETSAEAVEQMRRQQVPSLDAITAYQKGRELFERAHADSDVFPLLRQANGLFETAFGLAPGFIDAYIEHADLHVHVLLSQAAGRLEGSITRADLEAAPDGLRHDYDRALEHASAEELRALVGVDRAVLLGEWGGLAERAGQAVSATGCNLPKRSQLVLPLLDSRAGHIAASRDLVACDPLSAQSWVHLVRNRLWNSEVQGALADARRGVQRVDGPPMQWALAHALALAGQHEAARDVVLSNLRTEDAQLFARSWLAASAGDSHGAARYRDDFLARYGPDDHRSMVLEAVMGNRSEANRLAGQVDRRPFGHLVLLKAVYECHCGAPFDLEATPALAALLADSGLTWPPPQISPLPLKNW